MLILVKSYFDFVLIYIILYYRFKKLIIFTISMVIKISDKYLDDIFYFRVKILPMIAT